MEKFYSVLSTSQKRSLSLSLRILFIEYMENYNWDTSNFKSNEILVNDIYFYWLRNSAYRNYSWCEGLNIEIFSDAFAREIKKRIKNIIKEEKNKTRL